jgi:'Cold-shock' DNA-binding domain
VQTLPAPHRFPILLFLAVFVHHTAIQQQGSGFRTLEEGEKVKFDFQQTDRGLQAVNITNVDGTPFVRAERAPRSEGGFQRREGGYSGERRGSFNGERRPYTPRGDGERRPYTPRGPRKDSGEGEAPSS